MNIISIIVQRPVLSEGSSGHRGRIRSGGGGRLHDPQSCYLFCLFLYVLSSLFHSIIYFKHLFIFIFPIRRLARHRAPRPVTLTRSGLFGAFLYDYYLDSLFFKRHLCYLSSLSLHNVSYLTRRSLFGPDAMPCVVLWRPEALD